MGYNIDRSFDLRMPADVFPKVIEMAKGMYQESVANGDFDHLDLKNDPPNDDVMLAMVMETIYGEGGSLYVEPVGEGLNVEPEGERSKNFQIVGSTWGKGGMWEDTFTEKLAGLGITGVIDCMGEDSQLWRERLKDGEVTSHGGEVTYPTDKDESTLNEPPGPSLSGGIDLTDDEFAAFSEAARGRDESK